MGRDNLCSSLTHKAFNWSIKDPVPLLSAVTDAPWQIISKDKKGVVKDDSEGAQTSFVPAKGSIPVNIKWKSADKETSGTLKKQRTLRSHDASASSPAGLLWDGDDYSCAYDILITVLYDTWTNNTDHWTKIFHSINQEHLKPLASGFKKYLMGVDDISLEDVRDVLRKRLHDKHPTEFPTGAAGAIVSGLAAKIFYTRQTLASASVECTQCDYEEDPVDHRLGLVLYEMSNRSESTDLWLKNLEHHTSKKCPDCSQPLQNSISYDSPPPLLIFEINSNTITLNKTIGFEEEDGIKVLQLKGMVCHGGFHFTSHIVLSDGVVWFNDGMTTGRQCEKDGDLERMSSRKLIKCRGKKLVLAIYALV